MARRVAVGVIVIFALYGLYEARVLPFLLLFKITGLERPPESARYELRVLNETPWPVVATIYNLNDLAFSVQSLHEKAARMKINNYPDEAVMLEPEESDKLIVNSVVDRGLGVPLLDARTQIAQEGTKWATQRLALYAFSWYEATSQGRDENGDVIYPILRIEEGDFTVLESEGGKPDEQVRILRKSPERVRYEHNWNWKWVDEREPDEVAATD